jgi:hypothetical protein
MRDDVFVLLSREEVSIVFSASMIPISPNFFPKETL